MKHLFVPYDIARQLKEKGFNEPCLAGWLRKTKKEGGEIGLMSTHINNPLTLDNWHSLENTLAPLYQQVIDWFREQHGIRFKIEPTTKDQTDIFIYQFGSWKFIGKFSTDREALTKAIEEALKLI